MRFDALFRDRIRLAVLLSAFAMLPLLAVLTHRGVAPLLGLIALAAATRGETWRKGFAPLTPPFGWRSPETVLAAAFAGFCLWVGVSSLWSPTPNAARLTLNVLIAGVVAAAAVIEARRSPPRAARLLAFGFFFAAAAALALLCFEAMTGGLIRASTPPVDETSGRVMDEIRLGRGFAAILPSLFPAAGLIVFLAAQAESRRRTLYCAVLGLFFVTALWTALDYTMASNSAGVLAGTIAFAAALCFPQRTLAAMTVMIVALLCVAPFLFAAIPLEAITEHGGALLPDSWMQRLFVWKAAAGTSLDCLPFGCGADYARAMGAEGVMIRMPGSVRPLPLMPTHPHNVFLQIWLELGLVGVIFFGIAIVSGARRLLAAQLSRPVAAAVAGVAAAVFISAMVEISIWQMWRLAAAGLAAFGIAILTKFRDSSELRGDKQNAVKRFRAGESNGFA